MQNAIIRKNIEDKNFLVVKIKTKTAKALIDSGSSIVLLVFPGHPFLSTYTLLF